MRLKIPMTGTVTGFDPECYKLDGIGVSGDPNDPVRVVNLDLGIAWHLVSIDLETDLMEVEVEAPEKVDVPVLDAKGKTILDKDGQIQHYSRLTTLAEKQQILDNAQHILESKTTDEVYALTRDKRLVKPTSVIEEYRKAIMRKS